jgi:hypothetical protein
VVILVLALITTVSTFQTNQRVSAVSRCQQRYMQSVNEALRVRTDIADADRTNMFQLVQTVSTAKTEATVSNALHAYISAKIAGDKERAAHPYPNVQILKDCG